MKKEEIKELVKSGMTRYKHEKSEKSEVRKAKMKALIKAKK